MTATLGRRLLGDAARVVDSRSSRSRQRKLGPSSIGTCRRRAGFEHHRVPVSNPENVTGLPAILGTWVHAGALATMKAEWGTLIETVVEDDVLCGHVDGIDLPNPIRVQAGLPEVAGAPDVVQVDDLKTRRDGRMVDYVRNRGPKIGELFQVHLYGDLLRRGKVKPLQRQKRLAEVGPLPVETVRLRYFARTGEEGAEHVHEQPYDPDITAAALEWVDEVRRSESPADLNRDEDGPGLSVICDNCPFRTACWGDLDPDGAAPQSQLIVTDADLASTLADYDEARAVERDAKARKDKARKVLDDTDPAIYTDGEQAFKLGWSGGSTGDPKPDVDAMVALFNEADLEVPYLPPRRSARTIRLTRWDVPDQPCGKPINGCADDSEGDQPACVLKKGHSGDCTDRLITLGGDG